MRRPFCSETEMWPSKTIQRRVTELNARGGTEKKKRKSWGILVGRPRLVGDSITLGNLAGSDVISQRPTAWRSSGRRGSRWRWAGCSQCAASTGTWCWLLDDRCGFP